MCSFFFNIALSQVNASVHRERPTLVPTVGFFQTDSPLIGVFIGGGHGYCLRQPALCDLHTRVYRNISSAFCLPGFPTTCMAVDAGRALDEVELELASKPNPTQRTMTKRQARPSEHQGNLGLGAYTKHCVPKGNTAKGDQPGCTRHASRVWIMMI